MKTFLVMAAFSSLTILTFAADKAVTPDPLFNYAGNTIYTYHFYGDADQLMSANGGSSSTAPVMDAEIETDIQLQKVGSEGGNAIIKLSFVNTRFRYLDDTGYVDSSPSAVAIMIGGAFAFKQAPDGTILRVYYPSGEDLEVVNFKKGIAGMFQVNMASGGSTAYDKVETLAAAQVTTRYEQIADSSTSRSVRQSTKQYHHFAANSGPSTRHFLPTGSRTATFSKSSGVVTDIAIGESFSTQSSAVTASQASTSKSEDYDYTTSLGAGLTGGLALSGTSTGSASLNYAGMQTSSLMADLAPETANFEMKTSPEVFQAALAELLAEPEDGNKLANFVKTLRLYPVGAQVVGTLLEASSTRHKAQLALSTGLAAASIPAAQSMLASLLRDGHISEVVRQNILTSIVYVVNPQPELIEALEYLGEEGRPRTARLAWLALGAAAKHLKESEPETSEWLAANLAEKLSRAKSAQDRLVLLNGLGNSGSLQVPNWIAPYLADADKQVRRAAVYALRSVPGDEAESRLIEWVGDEDEVVRAQALKALSFRELSKPVLDFLGERYELESENFAKLAFSKLFLEKTGRDPLNFKANEAFAGLENGQELAGKLGLTDLHGNFDQYWGNGDFRAGVKGKAGFYKNNSEGVVLNLEIAAYVKGLGATIDIAGVEYTYDSTTRSGSLEHFVGPVLRNFEYIGMGGLDKNYDAGTITFFELNYVFPVFGIPVHVGVSGGGNFGYSYKLNTQNLAGGVLTASLTPSMSLTGAAFLEVNVLIAKVGIRAELNFLTMSWVNVLSIDNLFAFQNANLCFGSRLDLQPWRIKILFKLTINLILTEIEKSWPLWQSSGPNRTFYWLDNCSPVLAPSINGNTAENQTLTGQITLGSTPVDNLGLDRVSYQIDAGTVTTVSAAPYTTTFNSAMLVNGQPHTLTVKGYDKMGNLTTRTLTFYVNNQDYSAPTVSLTGQNDPYDSSYFIATANASDNNAIYKVEYYKDGVLIHTLYQAPYQYRFKKTLYAPGDYDLTARAYDMSMNGTTSNAVMFFVTGSTGGGSSYREEVEPNDSMSGATAIAAMMEEARGRISSATDLDYFSIQMNAGQIVRANLNRPVIGSTTYLYDLYLLNASGTVLAQTSGSTATAGFNYTIPTTGTYYIKIQRRSGASYSTTTSYTFTMIDI